MESLSHYLHGKNNISSGFLAGFLNHQQDCPFIWENMVTIGFRQVGKPLGRKRAAKYRSITTFPPKVVAGDEGM